LYLFALLLRRFVHTTHVATISYGTANITHICLLTQIGDLPTDITPSMICSLLVRLALWSLCQRRFHLYITREDKDEIRQSIEIAYHLAVLDHTIMQQLYGHAFRSANYCARQIKRGSIQRVS